MTIDPRLHDLLPLPAAPDDGAIDWPAVEAALGTPLPADYKAFVGTYGSGRIGGFLWIFNPAARAPTINLAEQAEAQRETLDELRADGVAIPDPAFPAAGGLLAFGMTDNGDVLNWRTAGAPDDWPVVVQESRAAEFWDSGAGLDGFLIGILSGATRCPIFPGDFPPTPLSFEPVSQLG